eukprot:2543351-Alexandrium_andersonii.AAC.1
MERCLGPAWDIWPRGARTGWSLWWICAGGSAYLRELPSELRGTCEELRCEPGAHAALGARFAELCDASGKFCDFAPRGLGLLQRAWL